VVAAEKDNNRACKETDTIAPVSGEAARRRPTARRTYGEEARDTGSTRARGEAASGGELRSGEACAVGGGVGRAAPAPSAGGGDRGRAAGDGWRRPGVGRRCGGRAVVGSVWGQHAT
jgi:hypothetical protein